MTQQTHEIKTRKYWFARRLGQFLSIINWFVILVIIARSDVTPYMFVWSKMYSAVHHHWGLLTAIATASLAAILYGYSHDDDGTPRRLLGFGQSPSSGGPNNPPKSRHRAPQELPPTTTWADFFIFATILSANSVGGILQPSRPGCARSYSATTSKIISLETSICTISGFRMMLRLGRKGDVRLLRESVSSKAGPNFRASLLATEP